MGFGSVLRLKKSDFIFQGIMFAGLSRQCPGRSPLLGEFPHCPPNFKLTLRPIYLTKNFEILICCISMSLVSKTLKNTQFGLVFWKIWSFSRDCSKTTFEKYFATSNWNWYQTLWWKNINFWYVVGLWV